MVGQQGLGAGWNWFAILVLAGISAGAVDQAFHLTCYPIWRQSVLQGIERILFVTTVRKGLHTL